MNERLIIVDGTVFIEAAPNYLVAVATVRNFLDMTPEQRAEAIKLVKITSGKTVQ